MQFSGKIRGQLKDALIRIHSSTQNKFRIFCRENKEEFMEDFEDSDGDDFEDRVWRYLELLNDKATLSIFVERLFKKINKNQEALSEFVELKKSLGEIGVSVGCVQHLFAYVITGTNDRVKNAIGEELFNQLNPPNHHDQHGFEWRPFIFQDDFSSNILQILDEFKKRYGLNQLKIEFLEVVPDQKKVFIDENKKNVIAIIDLLALDKENERTARLFDKSEFVAVFAPISRALPAPLMIFMENKNAEIFQTLQARYSLMSCELLQKSSEKKGMFQVLKSVVGKKINIKNEIADLNSLQDEEIRNLKSSL